MAITTTVITITSIDVKSETTRGGFAYVWEYTVKKQDAENPEKYIDINAELRKKNEKELRANEINVEDNMKIVYHLKAAAPAADADTSAETAE